MTAYVATKDLSKSFGQTHALCDVSIDVHSGKVHTVLGENGSGKSTLVKTLSGIVAADRGEIIIEGQPIKPRDPSDMISKGISVVLQEVLIAPNRTGIDNVFVGRDSMWKHTKSKSEKSDLLDSWLGKLSTRKISVDRLAGELPLNEQQVLVIARGFLSDPRLLILDEITAALDLADRNKVFDAIREFCADGGAVIFVSHRMPEIIELSDIVYVMHNGKNTAQLSGNDIESTILLRHLTQEAAT